VALGAGAAIERELESHETASALRLARLAALLDGQALAGLNASRKLQQQCQRLRHWASTLERFVAHASPLDGPLDGLGEGERLRLQRELEGDLPALLLALPAAPARRAMERWRDPADPLFHPQPPLNGNQLQQFLGLPPGPQLGQLLQHLCQERAFGRLACGREAAVVAARQWLDERRD
jgi:tRNA nucleotidyltransferase (CCA-adding enzyme)